jgi:hypothetical protein
MLTQEKSIQVAGFALMDEAESMLRLGHVQEGMARLILGMKSIKQNYNPNDWEKFTIDSSMSFYISLI